jgi:hypothetical protein
VPNDEIDSDTRALLGDPDVLPPRNVLSLEALCRIAFERSDHQTIEREVLRLKGKGFVSHQF